MSLTYDPAVATKYLGKQCKNVRALIKRCGPMDYQPKPIRSPFPVLMRVIIFQQLSGKAAGTIHRRVLELFPSKREITAQQLMKIADEDLRGAGVSRNKLAAIRDLAEKSIERTIPGVAAMRKMDDTEVIERLTTVRGIGVWTAQMFLMFQLGRPDVMPVDDLGVRKGYAITYDVEMPKPKELLELTERFAPYRSVLSWYLWRATDG